MSDGLEDVVAAHTTLSDVDGVAGRLVIRGRSLDDLAGRMAFEEMVTLMLGGLLPGLPEGAELQAVLGAARASVFPIVLRASLPAGLSPVEALRTWTALIPDGEDAGTAVTLLAAPAVFTAAAVRRARGLEPVAPEAGLSHAADTLRMLGGDRPSAAEAAALDAYLVTVADHGLNASTFAARVVASTRAGLVSAELAGISALKGPLHGGAPGPVIDMLDAIGELTSAVELDRTRFPGGRVDFELEVETSSEADGRLERTRAALEDWLERDGGIQAFARESKLARFEATLEAGESGTR